MGSMSQRGQACVRVWREEDIIIVSENGAQLLAKDEWHARSILRDQLITLVSEYE